MKIAIYRKIIKEKNKANTLIKFLPPPFKRAIEGDLVRLAENKRSEV